MRSQIIVALDGRSISECTEIAAALGRSVAGGKANDLIEDGGAGVLNPMNFSLRMLDPKLHDIKATMVNRFRKYDGNAEFVTLHASASFRALHAVGHVAKKTGVKAIAVTVLTDLSPRECRKTYGRAVKPLVAYFAYKARCAGLTGIVCSPQEVKIVRKAWPNAVIIVPGVRSVGTDHHDQKRVGTPYQTIFDGADYLVCGRQILEKRMPEQMRNEAQRINREVNRALEDRPRLTRHAA